MKKIYIVILAFATHATWAQVDSTGVNGPSINTADRLLQKNSNSKLSIGGYGEVNFYQPVKDNTLSNAELDVQRFVMMMAYKFTNRTQIITEIEYEHVKEVFIEQAFVQHRFNDFLNLRAGLMLIPMGIINEFHEPVTFNGVKRPNLSNKIVPTTWREIGIGLTGRIQSATLKYQVYITNGFNGYDGNARFKGENGFRGGRQKGAESFMSSPVFSAKLDYYGLPGLKVGAAVYLGKSQSSLFNGIDKNDELALAQADSSVVGIQMFGLNAIYQYKGLRLRGEYILSKQSNTLQYNAFTGSDLAKVMDGYYADISYNLFYGTKLKSELIPFIRYEKYYTHSEVDSEITQVLAYNRTDITMGIGYKITPGIMLKSDYQIYHNEDSNDSNSGQFNLGVAFWF